MRSHASLRLFVSLLAVALLLPAASAWATSTPNPIAGPGAGVNPAPPSTARGLVPAGVSVAGHDLGGMTETQARSVINAYVTTAGLPALTIKAPDHTFTLLAGRVLYPDVMAMVDAAYASRLTPVGGFAPVKIAPIYGVNGPAVARFVASLPPQIDRSGIDARWALSGNRLKLVASRTGRRTDVNGARSAVLTALLREAGTRTVQPAVTLPVTVTQPKVTEKQLGRAILVVLSERRVRLYDTVSGGSIIRSYGCAVGQPAWPTPTGLFHIVQKRYMPTWVNPGDSWGAGMPPSIPPGPGNPLGTRAMNLDAPGIRIHGTENVDSIGTAASHGCIRLVRHDVEQLYDLVVVGTPVFIVK